MTTKSTLKKRNPVDQLGVVVAVAAARTVRAVVRVVGPEETPVGVQVVAVDKLAEEELGLVRVTEEDLGRVVALQAQGLDPVDAQVVVGTVEVVAENTSSLATGYPTLA